MMFDDTIRSFQEGVKNTLWRDLDEEFCYYYAESELYLVRNKRTNGIYFMQARSPKQALDKVKTML